MTMKAVQLKAFGGTHSILFHVHFILYYIKFYFILFKNIFAYVIFIYLNYYYILEADQLYWGTATKPQVGPDTVLVKVLAAGVNRADIQQRKGLILFKLIYILIL